MEIIYAENKKYYGNEGNANNDKQMLNNNNNNRINYIRARTQTGIMRSIEKNVVRAIGRTERDVRMIH